MTDNEREMRRRFLPIAVLEHHQMVDPVLDPYTISDRLGVLWPEIQRKAETDFFTLLPDSVLSLNERVARALGISGCVFRNKDRWVSLVGELEANTCMEEDPSNMCSWLFSAVYWDHLTQCKLATTWLFINAFRIQHELPEYRLTPDMTGRFLADLSGSGPPIYDGQTFYLEEYAL